MKWIAMLVVMGVSVGVARAEEEERFACGKPKGMFEVQMKDEVALKDLVAWAMGFSCKRFVYGSALAGGVRS